jgi:hypothetical protein
MRKVKITQLPTYQDRGEVTDQFNPSYDVNLSPAENMELNRRAKVAGWNSVDEYRKSRWAYKGKVEEKKPIKNAANTNGEWEQLGYENKFYNYKNDPDFFDSHARLHNNSKANQWIKDRVYSGEWEYNPVTQETRKVGSENKANVSPETKTLAKDVRTWTKEEKLAHPESTIENLPKTEIEKLRKEDAGFDQYVTNTEKEAGKRTALAQSKAMVHNPAFYAPGAAFLGVEALPALWGAELLGTGITVGNVANTGFMANGVYNTLDPDSDMRRSWSKAYDNPNKSNLWDATLETGLNSLNFLGAKALPGDIAAFRNAKAPQLYRYLPEGIFSGYSKLKNPNMSYRVAGMDAYKDFQNTGIVRSRQPGLEKSNLSIEERMQLRPTAFPSFQKGYADLAYLPEEGGVVFETGLPTYKRGDINPVTGTPIKGRHYAHRVIDPKTGNTINNIPGADIRVFESTPNWLRGHKELDPGLTSLYRIEPKGATFPTAASPDDFQYLEWHEPLKDFLKDPRYANELMQNPEIYRTFDDPETGEKMLGMFYPQSTEGNWWTSLHPDQKAFPGADLDKGNIQMLEVKVPRKILPDYEAYKVSSWAGKPYADKPEWILPSQWRKGAKITDWDFPKKAEGGDISIPSLKRVKISELPKAQKGKNVLYVNSKNDPAYKAYRDSMDVYNAYPDLDLRTNWADVPDQINRDNQELSAFPNYIDIVPNLNFVNDHTIKPSRKIQTGITRPYKSHYGATNTVPVSNYVYKKPTRQVIVDDAPKPVMREAMGFSIPQVDIRQQLGNIPQLSIPTNTNKQRVVINTAQGDKIRVQDPKTKQFMWWEDQEGLPTDIENPTGIPQYDFRYKNGGALPKAQYGENTGDNTVDNKEYYPPDDQRIKSTLYITPNKEKNELIGQVQFNPDTGEAFETLVDSPDKKLRVVNYPYGYKGMAPGHIEAAIWDTRNDEPINNVGNASTRVNRWEYGNPEVSRYYKDRSKVRTADLNPSAARLAQFLKYSNTPQDYNFLMDNCADGVCRALGMDPRLYTTFGVTDPALVMDHVIGSGEFNPTNVQGRRVGMAEGLGDIYTNEVQPYIDKAWNEGKQLIDDGWNQGKQILDNSWNYFFKKEGGSITDPPSTEQDGTFDYYMASKRLNDEKRRIERMRSNVIPVSLSHSASSDNKPFKVKLPEGQHYCTTRACEIEREAGFPINQVASGYKIMKETTPENGWYPTTYNTLLPGDIAQVVRNSGGGHTMVSTGDAYNMPELWYSPYERDPNLPKEKGFFADNGSGREFDFMVPSSENELADWMNNVKKMNYYTYKGNLPQYQKEFQQAAHNYLHNTSEGDYGPMAPIDAIPHKKQGGDMKRVKIHNLPKAQYGPPDWRNMLDYRNAAPPAKQNLVGDVRKVARPTAVAESTKVPTQKLPANFKQLKEEADANAAADRRMAEDEFVAKWDQVNGLTPRIPQPGDPDWRKPYPNDPAGLPSVPIFESLLMAPVALGEAGLAGLGDLIYGAASSSPLMQATVAGGRQLLNAAPKAVPWLNAGNALTYGFGVKGANTIMSGEASEPWRHANSTGNPIDYANAVASNLMTALEIAPFAGAAIKTGVEAITPITSAFMESYNTRRALAQIQNEGLQAGLTDFEIAQRQLAEVGITSNQRQGYKPIVSELANHYLTPIGYSGSGPAQNKIQQTIGNITRGGWKNNLRTQMNKATWDERLPEIQVRSDAWRTYLGMPQQHGTFTMANTAPTMHAAYPPGSLKGMDIYNIPEDKVFAGVVDKMSRGLTGTGSSKFSEVMEPLDKAITLHRENYLMGGYNQRLTQNGLEYNDIWDVEPFIKFSDFVPKKIQGLLPTKVQDKLFMKTIPTGATNPYLRQTMETPRGFTVKLDKFIGKPFMSHGLLDYTSTQHASNVRKRLLSEIGDFNNSMKYWDDATNSVKMRELTPNQAKYLSDLQTKLRELYGPTYPKQKKGGETKRVKINGLPKNWKTK